MPDRRVLHQQVLLAPTCRHQITSARSIRELPDWGGNVFDSVFKCTWVRSTQVWKTRANHESVRTRTLKMIDSDLASTSPQPRPNLGPNLVGKCLVVAGAGLPRSPPRPGPPRLASLLSTLRRQAEPCVRCPREKAGGKA
jgi:hypothetical protein